MAAKAGVRLACPACATELVVVLPPHDATVVTCGGVEMRDPAVTRHDAGHVEVASEHLQLGKRYVDAESRLEVLCVKSGSGVVAADGRPLAVKSAKPLPASD